MDTNTPFTDINAGVTPSQSFSDNSAFLDASSDVTQGSNAFTDTQPQDVNKADQYLGNEDFEGLCETFAEQMTNSPKIADTAQDAWNTYATQGRAHTGLQGVQPGDLVYFSADSSNGGNGHVAIYTGGNNIISPDYTGIHMHRLSDWISNTGQTPLGYVTPQ